jgi:hypothetical protein
MLGAMQRAIVAVLVLSSAGCDAASGVAARDAGSLLDGRLPEAVDGGADASLAPEPRPDASGLADAGDLVDAAQADDGGPLAPGFTLPPGNAALDYQLGGAYAPPSGVGIVSRDRTEAPAAGLYNICYVNGFQVQPGEEGDWPADLILRDNQGQPVIDPDWDEQLLDVSTSDKRTRIADVIEGWIDGCAQAGFDAVEVDNLDTYSRSGGRITQQNAVDFMALLSAHAHRKGLAIAQKNSTELLARRSELGTDFAVAEECSRYAECGDYVAAYGEHVLMIEYRRADFEQGCQAYGATHSIVLRDLNLVPKGAGAYVFEGC